MPDILVWNRCNNNCLMCTRPESFFRSSRKRYSFDSLNSRLVRYMAGETSAFKRRRGDTGYFLLTGGEPTLHPDFFRVMRLFCSAKVPGGVCLLTNGRMFSYTEFARRFCALPSRNLLVAVSLCGPDPEIHDAVAGCPGSFEQALAGIKNLLAFRKPGLTVEIRFVLHGRTAPHLNKTLAILERAIGRRGYRLTLLFHKSTGRAVRNAGLLDLPLSRAADLIARSGKRLSGFDCRLYHFPLCVLPAGLRGLAESTLAPSDAVFPREKCRGCSLRKSCCGLLKEYYLERGAGELSPL